MMQQLTYALEGGNTVTKNSENMTPEIEVKENKAEEMTNFTDNQDKVNESLPQENNIQVEDAVTTSFVDKKEKEEEDKKEDDASTDEEDTTEEEDKEKEEDKKKEYSLLEEKYNTLKADYELLEKENKELKEFKINVENKQKDELISEFYMLSDEDKKDVIENKSNYTLDEIKSKLAVICFEKKVNFNLDDNSKNNSNIDNKEKDSPVVTFNIEHTEDVTPDWVKAVESTMHNF